MAASPEQLSASDARGATAADLLLTSGLVVVEQAKAALSARFGVTPDEAFHLLQGLACSQRRSLPEFAAEVLRNRGRLDGDLVGDAGRVLE
jgi:AmiR/NasT family two-component response regulator